MATSFTTHSAGQVITSADVNLIQTAVNAVENVPTSRLWVGQTAAATSSANAFKGCLFTPSANMTILALAAPLTGFSITQSYKAMVVTLASNAVGATTIASVLGSSDTLTTTFNSAGPPYTFDLPFSTPVALVSGTTYALLVGMTSGAGSFVLPMYLQSDFGASLLNVAPPGSLGANVVVAVASPVATSAATVSSASGAGRLVPGIVAKG